MREKLLALTTDKNPKLLATLVSRTSCPLSALMTGKKRKIACADDWLPFDWLPLGREKRSVEMLLL